MAVILPQKVWTLANHQIGSQTEDTGTFYTNNANHGKYFVGGDDTDNVIVPFMLFIPLVTVKILIYTIRAKCLMSTIRPLKTA